MVGEGGPCALLPLACPPLRVPSRFLPIFPAWGRRHCVPCHPLACLVLGLHPPMSRLPRGGRVEGWGARVLPCLRPRRRSSPVALPPARCPRRVSGGAAWRRAPVASSGIGSARPLGGLRASARTGCPPSATSRRQPWTVLPRSVLPPCRPCPPTLRLSLPSDPPQASARVQLLSFPASAPPLAHPARSCPASRHSPPPSLVRGAWVAGAGRDREGVGGLVCLRSERGLVRPGGFWGGRVGKEGGVRWRRGPVVVPRGPGSITGQQLCVSCPAGLAAAGISIEAVVACGPIPPTPRLACPPPPSRYLAHPGAEV